MSKKNLKNIEEEKQQEPQPNLCYMVQMHLQNIGYVEGANSFKSHPMVATVWEIDPHSQRVILNRYFSLALLTFRGLKNVPVHNVIDMLIQDGTLDDWFKVFAVYVAPFLKEHKILEVTNI